MALAKKRDHVLLVTRQQIKHAERWRCVRFKRNGLAVNPKPDAGDACRF
jgi:hypothetical protein